MSGKNKDKKIPEAGYTREREKDAEEKLLDALYTSDNIGYNSNGFCSGIDAVDWNKLTSVKED
jgi:hypothetical protein